MSSDSYHRLFFVTFFSVQPSLPLHFISVFLRILLPRRAPPHSTPPAPPQLQLLLPAAARRHLRPSARALFGVPAAGVFGWTSADWAPACSPHVLQMRPLRQSAVDRQLLHHGRWTVLLWGLPGWRSEWLHGVCARRGSIRWSEGRVLGMLNFCLLYCQQDVSAILWLSALLYFLLGCLCCWLKLKKLMMMPLTEYEKL